jgi:hypothetical protein
MMCAPIKLLRGSIAVSRSLSTLSYQVDMSRVSLRVSLRLNPLATISVERT